MARQEGGVSVMFRSRKGKGFGGRKLVGHRCSGVASSKFLMEGPVSWRV